MESGDEPDIEGDTDTDRIGALPEDILQKILSCVRIRTVVRMRRLSRMWRKQCESLQFILLDQRDFRHWKVEKFARFVNNLLLIRQKVDLHTFQLHWDNSGPLNCNDVRMWIGYAVKHNVKVLDVELCRYDKTGLPPGIFTCRSLQELNLQWGEACDRGLQMGLILPNIINLPSLKKLTLRDVQVDGPSLNRFISQSPGLEDLHLIDSAMYLERIASTALKRLTIDNFQEGCTDVKISAPHLISFECSSWPLEAIFWIGQHSLESARIDTDECTFGFDADSKFIGVLANAKKLALFGADLKIMLEKGLPTCSLFENLTTLEIGNWYLIKDLSVVLRFLRLSPRLEKLTLMHKSDDKATDTDGMSIDGMSFQCPFLESVIIQCSKDDVGIDELVNVLVVNRISADKISITLEEDIMKRERVEGMCAHQERLKELAIFEKMAEENPEWIYEPDSEDEESDDDF